MITLIKRVLLVVLLVTACYYASKLALAFRLAEQTGECTTESDRKIVGDASSSETDKLRVTARTFSCVANKQSALDRLFFDARKYFDDPTKWPFPIDEYRAQFQR